MNDKSCAHCAKSLLITENDQVLYTKLGVPAPTFCPTCRLIRRLAVRNERFLYRSYCAVCGRKMLSMYSEDSPYIVFCTECYWSDSWSALDYGIAYDFSKPFFTQFKELQLRVPRENLWQIQCTNSSYANFLREAKNSYLSYSCVYTEDVYYSKNVDKSRYIFDSLDVSNSENCYEIIKGDRNANSAFLIQSSNCLDSWFLYNCQNCTNCALCSNLRGKQYCFLNQEFDKSEYWRKIKALETGNRDRFEALKKEFKKLVHGSVHKFANITNGIESTGDDLMNVKNAKNCFSCYNLENVSYAFRSFNTKDSLDLCNIYENELMYECVSGGTKQSARVYFTMHGFSNLRDVEYTDSCHSSHDLFGSVGVRKAEYCILNKQYEEDEYKDLKKRIVEQMNSMPYKDNRNIEYRYGEFFPIELSPFSYNETYALEYFPLTKEETVARGYKWKDQEKKDYKITMESQAIPVNIKDVQDNMTSEILECAHVKTGCNEQCTTAFKIVRSELDFYKKMNLPLPILCPNCRHYTRLNQKNPLGLQKRTCNCTGVHAPVSHLHGISSCLNKFETAFTPDREYVVYCETCYQNEFF